MNLLSGLYNFFKILIQIIFKGFGRADHEISVSLLKEKYPDYESITFSNEGY